MGIGSRALPEPEAVGRTRVGAFHVSRWRQGGQGSLDLATGVLRRSSSSEGHAGRASDGFAEEASRQKIPLRGLAWSQAYDHLLAGSDGRRRRAGTSITRLPRLAWADAVMRFQGPFARKHGLAESQVPAEGASPWWVAFGERRLLEAYPSCGERRFRRAAGLPRVGRFSTEAVASGGSCGSEESRGSGNLGFTRIGRVLQRRSLPRRAAFRRKEAITLETEFRLRPIAPESGGFKRRSSARDHFS